MFVGGTAVEHIKKGPLATRITTHHLVRILLYYCWSVFFCLTIGSKRREFCLSVRHRDMAHKYKLAPVIDDSTNCIDWCKELDVWGELTELAKEKKPQQYFHLLQGNLRK